MVTIDARGIHHIHAKMDPHGRHSVSDEGTVKPKPSTGNKGKVAPVKLPRPPNSFILYRQRHHPDIKAEHPELHNNEICKSMIILSRPKLNFSSLNSRKAVAE